VSIVNDLSSEEGWETVEQSSCKLQVPKTVYLEALVSMETTMVYFNKKLRNEYNKSFFVRGIYSP